MGFSWEKLLLITVFLIMGTLENTVASIHKVGGSAGWTILNKVDYNKWTSSDTFTAGDSLLFVYNTQFHNVKQVSRHDFLSCNATSAIATYTSGSDIVVLTRPGHFYFLCGFPGHCQGGQKLHVLVGDSIASPSPSPSPSTGSSSSPATASRDSTENGAVSLSVSTRLTLAMSGVVLFLVALVTN